MSDESDDNAQELLDDLRWRGLLHQSTDEAELRAHLAGGSRRIYCGFDPTADSLTIGNLLPVTLLARFRRAGHVPVVLFGGATGQIGDPSFKSAERTLLDPETAAANLDRHRNTIRSYLETVDGPDAVFVDNLDWLGPMPLLTFLRDVGKHFSVNDLLRRDAVRDRIEGREQGLSFTEFSYALLQAYDYLHLNESAEVTLQVGASDQWGNIVGGVDLVRRVTGRHVHALTCPLLVKRDGTKFGKTESGAVWLSADRLSPYGFYQFLVNLEDDLVDTFMRFYSLRPRPEVESLLAEQAEAPGRRVAQRAIAAELTERLHGATAVERAIQTSEALFTGSVAELDLDQIDDALVDVPSATVSRTELDGGLDPVELFVRVGLAASKSEARRLHGGGALSCNGSVLAEQTQLAAGDLLHDRVLLLRKGKRAWGIVRVQP